MLNSLKKMFGKGGRVEESAPVEETAPEVQSEPEAAASPDPSASRDELEPPASQAPPTPPTADAPPPAAHEAKEMERIREQVVRGLKTVYDPEIPVNIHDLGLIYSVDVEETGLVKIRMTLTSPNCPAAGTLPGEVEAKAATVEGVTGVELDLVWEPPWDKDKMSEAAKLELGIF